MRKISKEFKDLVKISFFMNTFEWYDFAIVGSMLFVLGKLFFPAHMTNTILSLGLLTFTVPFITRPIGALFLGYIALKKTPAHALQWSMFLMMVPTALVGFLPTYATMGALAPVILILLRLIQGIGMGGESASAYGYGSLQKRNYLLFGFMGAGAIMAFWLPVLVVLLLKFFLSNTIILNWAWRIPFWLSIPLSALVFYMRQKIFKYQKPYILFSDFHLFDFLKGITIGSILLGFMGVSFIIVFFYYPVYVSTINHTVDFHYVNLFTFPIMAASILLFAYFNESKNITHTIYINIISTIMLFIFFIVPNIPIILWIKIIGIPIFLGAITYHNIFTTSYLFQDKTRVLGVALSFALSNFIFSFIGLNLIQNIFHADILIKWAIYIAILGILSVILLLKFKKNISFYN